MLKKFGIYGKFKVTFFVLGFHNITPSYLFLFYGNISLLSKWIKKNKSNPNCESFKWKFNYNKRFELYKKIIEQERLNEIPIEFMEFGVSKGHSFRWWCTEISNSLSKFHGFDTFNGLPEDWGYFKKGDMSNGNHPPEINDDRVDFYQGIFQQTLIPFLNSNKIESKKVIHMDADLYSSTLYVLSILTPYLKKGDIIFFDEFNVPMHEWKAFKEWTESFYIQYSVLGSVNNFYQTVIQIE